MGIFRDITSRTWVDQTALNQIMELAQARKIDVVLVTEFSRWRCSTQDLLDTLHKLAGWNVSLIAMSGITLELNTPHGRIMATLLVSVAQFELDLLSEQENLALPLHVGRNWSADPASIQNQIALPRKSSC